MNEIPEFLELLLQLQEASAKRLFAFAENNTADITASEVEVKTVAKQITNRWPDATSVVPGFGDMMRHAARFCEKHDMRDVLHTELPMAIKWCVEQMLTPPPTQGVGIDGAVDVAREYAAGTDNARMESQELQDALAIVSSLKATVERGINELQGGQVGIQEKLQELNRRVQFLQGAAYSMGKKDFGVTLLGTVASLAAQAIIPNPGAFISSLLPFRG